MNLTVRTICTFPVDKSSTRYPLTPSSYPMNRHWNAFASSLRRFSLGMLAYPSAPNTSTFLSCGLE
eukprot:jgi/Phyca11/133648/e_gw1.619.4.1